MIDVRTTTSTTTTLSPSTTSSPYCLPATSTTSVSSSASVSPVEMNQNTISHQMSLEIQDESQVPLLMIETDNKKDSEEISQYNPMLHEKLENVFQEFDGKSDYDEPSSNSNNLDENSTRNSLDDETDKLASSSSESQQKTPTKPTCSSNKVSGPKILFEIQSEDGFTYKSTSITEIWEKVFETVQLARKAHGLMPLPEGRLSEMTGDQMLGLKTNALKYLLEQLPGVEKCSKYTPKYHKSSSTGTSSMASSTATSTSAVSMNNNFSSSSSHSSNSNLSSASSILSTSMTSLNQYLLSDSDELLFENIYGAARFEPFSSRSEYDMFSWLASRHRKQPMPVVFQNQNEENLVLR